MFDLIIISVRNFLHVFSEYINIFIIYIMKVNVDISDIKCDKFYNVLNEVSN